MNAKFLAFLILIIALATSCDPKPAGRSSGGDSDDTTGETSGNGGGGFQFPGSGSSGPGTGSTCYGTAEDGTGDGNVLLQFNLLASGGKNWLPGNYPTGFSGSDAMAQETMITIEEGHYFFATDSRLKVRFKVMPQPSPPAGEKYCYDRATGQAADVYTYTKLKFTLYLRDVICNQYSNSDPSKCVSYSLGNRYATQTVGPVNVNECSQIIDLGSIRSQSSLATVVEVAYVNSDSYCQSNGQFCPAEKKVRDASCWSIKMQVATDSTQNFR